MQTGSNDSLCVCSLMTGSKMRPDLFQVERRAVEEEGATSSSVARMMYKSRTLRFQYVQVHEPFSSISLFPLCTCSAAVHYSSSFDPHLNQNADFTRFKPLDENMVHLNIARKALQALFVCGLLKSCHYLNGTSWSLHKQHKGNYYPIN